jgi:lipopolysaccharide transport system permease protein
MKLVIEPGLSSANYWRDLWRYRELLLFLAWRDISVRYKQTVIGVAWAVVRPALTMAVFVAFRRMAGIDHSAASDTVLVMAAVLPWQFVSTAVGDSSSSLINNTNLISKVYFPRLIVPIGAVVTAFADFLVTLALLAVVMLWERVAPSTTFWALPLFAMLAAALSIGVGLFFSALNVEYRDFRYVVPFLIQLGLFVSPIAFTAADVPARWRTVYLLNPVAGIIDGFRWSILGSSSPLDVQAVVLSAIVSAAALVLGVWYFRRMERGFADVI